MTDATDVPRHRGQALKGSDNDWSRRRLAAGLSITDVAEQTGIPRSLVGLIDKGRMTPTLDELERLLAVYRSGGESA